MPNPIVLPWREYDVTILTVTVKYAYCFARRGQAIRGQMPNNRACCKFPFAAGPCAGGI